MSQIFTNTFFLVTHRILFCFVPLTMYNKKLKRQKIKATNLRALNLQGSVIINQCYIVYTIEYTQIDIWNLLSKQSKVQIK